jgi:hypothetical protein
LTNRVLRIVCIDCSNMTAVHRNQCRTCVITQGHEVDRDVGAFNNSKLNTELAKVLDETLGLPVKFSDTVSFLIKELTPPHSGLYRFGPLHTNLVSLTPTVTFSALESLTRTTVKNKGIMADVNAMAYNKKAVGERFSTIESIRTKNYK